MEALRQRGWEVVRASERLSPRAPDREILELARREGWTVLTQDLDFSTLLALSGQAAPSLVTLRLSSTDPHTATRRLLELSPILEQALEMGCAITIEDQTVRVRRLPIR